MKIIVYDNSGHPFQVQLSRALTRRGFEVLHLYSASFQTPKGNLIKLDNDPDNFNVKSIALPSVFKKYSFIKRWQQENLFGKLVNECIADFNPDVLIASNVPLDTLKHVQRFCKKNNIKFIFWVQDFYGIAIKSILKRKFSFLGTLIGDYYISLEKKLLNESDHIILISEHFIDTLKKMKVKNSNYSIIHNWAPINELPVESKVNDWSLRNNLNDKFCFMYTGTLGLKHCPELLIYLAEVFKEYQDIRVVIISEGIGADWLKKRKKELDLHNLILLPFQPYEILPRVLATGDVLISILEEEAGIFSVPSKVLSYLSAGKPILLSIPVENLAAKIIADNNCGYVISPSDTAEFINKAYELYKSTDLRLKFSLNSRKYAEKYFDIEKITDKFELILREYISNLK